VSVFRIEHMKERPHQSVEQSDHETGSKVARRAVASSGSGRAHCTAASGSAP
jgi:hypothetical protein